MRPHLPTAVAVALIVPAASSHAETDWSAVGQAPGREGAEQPGGVHRFSVPRSDLSVALDGVAVAPGFALGSWVAFEAMGDQVMAMGDLVLSQDEIAPSWPAWPRAASP